MDNNTFKTPWWLPGAHLQTIWPTATRRPINIEAQNERLELPDGDFLDLAWVGSGNGPIVVVLHGLGGNIQSPYATGILQAIAMGGWRGVFMHFRGCSGVPNRLPRSYHSGETGDLHFVIHELRRRETQTPLAVIGFSLGGNVLIKWLGETGNTNPLHAAIAVSVPFELHKSATHLSQGGRRFYQWWLLRQLRTTLKKKFTLLPAPTDLIDLNKLDKLNTFWEFDDKITAPLHGFNGAADYYQRASSRPYLPLIKTPTLILQARDDPFIPVDALPEPHELAPQTHLELTENGGHVGFVTGNLPWQPIYWLEQRAVAYLQKFLA